MFIEKGNDCYIMLYLGQEFKDRNTKNESTGRWESTGEQVLMVRMADNEGRPHEFKIMDKKDWEMFDGLKMGQACEVSLKLHTTKDGYYRLDIVSIMPSL